MPVHLQDSQLPLSSAEVTQLWQVTIASQHFPDEMVGVACVDRAAIQRLNAQYRHKDKPTNVLTFSYRPEHDIVLSLEVAAQEALEREMSLRDYVALLLVHAFLHATGLDHEQSAEAADQMRQTERQILANCGFAITNL